MPYSNMDPWSLLHVSVIWYWDYCRPYTCQISSLKALWQILAQSSLFSYKSYYQIIRLLLDSLLSYTTLSHSLLLAHLKLKQQQKIKSYIVDIENRYNEIVLSFDPLNKEFSPGWRIIDLFEDHFLFHMVKNNNDNNLKAHCLSLDNITLTSLLDFLIALVVMDTSVKNQVATLIMYIHR